MTFYNDTDIHLSLHSQVSSLHEEDRRDTVHGSEITFSKITMNDGKMEWSKEFVKTIVTSMKHQSKDDIPQITIGGCGQHPLSSHSFNSLMH